MSTSEIDPKELVPLLVDMAGMFQADGRMNMPIILRAAARRLDELERENAALRDACVAAETFMANQRFGEMLLATLRAALAGSGRSEPTTSPAPQRTTPGS